ncbi:NAD-dependent epimerase/dehydratase family protein [Nostocoides sp. F2B08]|uniref:NAD-dependent epimerase/dehydratase family protein n=1 Tax=Nostocoides sp. F2B08 TaxID=2653936 RepID=UPI0012630C5D|nr:NAD-dependent epimerase/dehydratase family protein [Tetrasphaera sp. F2B08]KAB7744798.1 NAD-dependent epimerase/dehydratase family protein [Tetrasphaera sp. F2B08]
MNNLILGGAGFIGAHLAARLLRDGRRVTIVDDFSRGTRDAAIADLERSGARLVSADLTRPDPWVLLGQDWDEVYHLVAVVGVRNVEQDPLRCMRVNTLATLNLIDWVPRKARVFYSSTSEVYAGGVAHGIVPVPTAESAMVVVDKPTAPRAAYAVSKLWGEAALSHAGAARGFDWVTGRFHNVYGPRMGMSHVVPEMLARAAAGETPFRVWGADQTRAFCYVDDAVEAVVRLMRTPRATGRIVHIGTTAETHIIDLARIVLSAVGVDPPLQVLQGPDGSVSRRCPDTSLLYRLTGHVPRIELPEGVRRTWQWYSTSGLNAREGEAGRSDPAAVAATTSTAPTAPAPVAYAAPLAP